MKYTSVCVFLFFSTYVINAQKKSLKKQFIKDSLEIMRPILIRPQLRVDNRIVYHQGQRLNINGIDGGVLLKEKLRLAIGYYALNDNLSSEDIEINGTKTERLVKMKYCSINTEYIYLNKRFFSLGLPLDFGFGKNTLAYKNTVSGEISGNKTGFLFLIDFGFSVTFKPTRWIGVRAVLGYRKFIINPVEGLNFDGLFNSVGLSIDIKEIIKDVRMYRLKKKYHKGNLLGNAVDLITD